ncbi:hypothetical protein YC2023_095275 [Brassica napus]
MGAIAISHFQQLLVPQTSLTSPCPPTWFQALSTFRCPELNAVSMVLLPHRSTSPGMKGITAYIGTAFEHRTRSRHQRLPSSKTNSQASGTPIQLSPPRCSNSGLLTNVRAPSSEPTTLHSVPSTHPPPYFHFGLMPLLNFVLGCAHKTARWA